MKSPFLALRPLDELLTLQVHEAVRDYPELLPALAPPGGPEGRRGSSLLSEVIPEVPGGEAEILSLLSWRGGVG